MLIPVAVGRSTTVTLQVAVRPLSLVAVISASPVDTKVILPVVADTRTTDLSLVDQVRSSMRAPAGSKSTPK